MNTGRYEKDLRVIRLSIGDVLSSRFTSITRHVLVICWQGEKITVTQVYYRGNDRVASPWMPPQEVPFEYATSRVIYTICVTEYRKMSHWTVIDSTPGVQRIQTPNKQIHLAVQQIKLSIFTLFYEKTTQAAYWKPQTMLSVRPCSWARLAEIGVIDSVYINRLFRHVLV